MGRDGDLRGKSLPVRDCKGNMKGRETGKRLTSLKNSRSSQSLIKYIILATTKPTLVQKFVYERFGP